MENKPTIKSTDVGCYTLDNIVIDTPYLIIHKEGQEPKIEKHEN